MIRIAYIKPFNVRDGVVLTNTTIDNMINSDTELRMMADIANAPNSVNNPTIINYLQLEANDGFTLSHIDQNIVMTTSQSFSTVMTYGPITISTTITALWDEVTATGPIKLILLRNESTDTNIYFSHVSGFTTAANRSVIPFGEALVLDANSDAPIYLLTASGTANLSVVIGLTS